MDVDSDRQRPRVAKWPYDFNSIDHHPQTVRLDSAEEIGRLKVFVTVRLPAVSSVKHHGDGKGPNHL